jgi:hypothetical protein
VRQSVHAAATTFSKEPLVSATDLANCSSTQTHHLPTINTRISRFEHFYLSSASFVMVNHIPAISAQHANKMVIVLVTAVRLMVAASVLRSKSCYREDARMRVSLIG